MNPLRKKKLESSILREFAQLLVRHRGKDEDLDFVSVTAVDLARDFRTAKISLSFFGQSEQSNTRTFEAIQTNIGYFQTTIGRNLRLRYTPRLYLSIVSSILPSSMEVAEDESSIV